MIMIALAILAPVVLADKTLTVANVVLEKHIIPAKRGVDAAAGKTPLREVRLPPMAMTDTEIEDLQKDPAIRRGIDTYDKVSA